MTEKLVKQLKLPDSYFYHQNIAKDLKTKKEYLYTSPRYELKIIGRKISSVPLHRIENLIKFLNISSIIKIKWWPTSNKKKFINLILGPEDINSGATDLKTIMIWRNEEFNKVMTHEIVHFSRNHFLNWNSSIDIYLKERFNIQGKVVSTEAYTEWLAILLHCKFICYNLEPWDNKLLSSLLYNEYLFSLIQCIKVINHSVGNLEQLGKNIWRQKTDVFSYFIVKTALLADIKYWFTENPNNWRYCCSMEKYFFMDKARLTT